MPITEKQLRDAHIERHRVARSLGNLARLNKEEMAIFNEMKSHDWVELSKGNLTAKLEPRRFSVPWSEVVKKGLGPRQVADLVQEAEDRNEEARMLFGDPHTRWTEEALAMERLVIVGH